MNENITYHILNYINQSTNYAVVISGNYGIGKTHFVQSLLFPKIEEIKIEGKQKFKTITISLFGIKSIEDVEKIIFLELFAPKDWQKKSAKILGAVARGAGGFFNIDIDKVLKESTLSAGDLNKYNNLVICIDDIDRKSNNLNLSEVYGFINNLTENLGAKVILIANENTLRRDFNESNSNAYSILREKVIGVSFPFQSDLNQIFDEIIKKFENSCIPYFNFLKENSDYIIDCIKRNENNIRNLIFFVEQFKIVFIELKHKLETITNDLKNRIDEILEIILKSYLPISLEYKLGNLSDENQIELVDYLDGKNFDWGLANLKNDEEQELSFLEKFKNKYNFNRNELHYFESLFIFIIGVEKYNVDKNIEELESFFNINEDNYDDKKEIFEKLKYWKVVDLSFNDYKIYTKKLINLAFKGELQIDEYADAYLFALRFDNLLHLNPDDLKGKFLKSLERNSKKINYKKIHFFYRVSLERTNPLFPNFEQILLKCRQINADNKNRILQDELNALYQEFSDNSSNFILTCTDNILFVENTFFSKFEFLDFWRIIKSLSNTNLIEFGYVIESRFTNSHSDYESEKLFLQQLKVKVQQKIEVKSTPKMDKISWKFLMEKIDISLTVR